MTDKNNYLNYLKSEHWQETKKKYLLPDSKCRVCNQKEGLELHHKTYVNIGKETEEDFLILCRGCHKKIHFHKGKQIKDLDKVMTRYLNLYAQHRYRERRTKTLRISRRQARRNMSCAARYDKNYRYN